MTVPVERSAAVDVYGPPHDERGGGVHEEPLQGLDVLGPATARDDRRLIRSSGRDYG
ncbi:hypothetical protein [Streptomyces hydrogenans]|uniref:hypothetical protein n=1 Tax=Streptomyces hydrogenans TaxID=1873719 RepID=UPI003437B6A8